MLFKDTENQSIYLFLKNLLVNLNRRNLKIFQITPVQILPKMFFIIGLLHIVYMQELNLPQPIPDFPVKILRNLSHFL